MSWDFPGSPPCRAGDTGWIPAGRGTGIPPATGQVSPGTTAREPAQGNEDPV